MKIAEFTIPLPPRTKKNSQQIITLCGRPMIIPSKLYKQYEKDCAAFMPQIETIDKPVNVQAVYYMPTRRRVDLRSLEDVAEYKHKSYRWVTAVHGRALSNVQRILNKKQNDDKNRVDCLVLPNIS